MRPVLVAPAQHHLVEPTIIPSLPIDGLKMSTTPSNRSQSRLAPTAPKSLADIRRSRSCHRNFQNSELRLTLERVVGTTCNSPTGFSTANSCFAYTAGGAVVVVDVDAGGQSYSQRFFRARPTAVPIYGNSGSCSNASPGALPHSPTPYSTPKANDSWNRASKSPREDGWDSPSLKTWTSRERIKAATCLMLSREGRFLAVGETGYAPRVLIFSLEASSSNKPLVSLCEHMHGVKAVAWSPDSTFLASLGVSSDGFLYMWKVDPRTGSARLFQRNRCTSYVRGMIWVGNSLITLGVRHVKLWRPDDGPPERQRFAGESSPCLPPTSLPGRNVLLNDLIDATFVCAAAIDDSRAVICSEEGDVCLFKDTNNQMTLTSVVQLGFQTHCVAVKDGVIYVGGKVDGYFATLDLRLFTECDRRCLLQRSAMLSGLFALGFLDDLVVTVDNKRKIEVWDADYLNGLSGATNCRALVSPSQDAIVGIDVLQLPILPDPDLSAAGGAAGAAFYTWSGRGDVTLWTVTGQVQSSFRVPLQEDSDDTETERERNSLSLVKATVGGQLFITGDRRGVLRVIDHATQECTFETKAHTHNFKSISVYEDDSTLLVASCGRDRTAQLFHRTSCGGLEHFQTLEFAAKVAEVLIPSADKIITCSLDRSLQIHHLVTKQGERDVMAAIPARVISLRGSPASMAMSADHRGVFVSLLDRSICLYDIETGKLRYTFKCTDETGSESVVLDCLIARAATQTEPGFLLGVSNTDKSIRLYDAQTGQFLYREWGHTEAINGAALLDGSAGTRVVSVGSDATLMVWALNMHDLVPARHDSPPSGKEIASTGLPLRRVLSKTDLAEFQRTTPSRRPSSSRPRPRTSGRRSPPTGLAPKRSMHDLRRAPPLSFTNGRRAGSPPVSPQPGRQVCRRPSLPVMRTATRSSSNALTRATEHATQTLRTYRMKLSSREKVDHEVLLELDRELRLTALALGDRASQSKVLSDQMLDQLMDQYSNKLVDMLSDKMTMRSQESQDRRPPSSDTGSTSSVL